MNRKILVVLAVLAIALAVVDVSIEAQRGGGGGGMRGGSGGGGVAPVPDDNSGNYDNGGNIDNGGNVDNGGNIGNVGNFPPTSVSRGGYGFYIDVGQSKQWVYGPYDIAVSYLSASPKQVVIVTLDGSEKLIEVELTADVPGIYWREGDLSFTLKPAVWVFGIYSGQLIRIPGGTWNTTVLYFEVIDKGAVPPDGLPDPGNY